MFQNNISCIIFVVATKRIYMVVTYNYEKFRKEEVNEEKNGFFTKQTEQIFN